MTLSTSSRRIAATCALASTLLSALADESPVAKNWREVSSGTQSNLEEATQHVIQTPEAWAKWWIKHTTDRDHPENTELPKPPTVDFNKETILIATMGIRSTGGHRIHFSKIYHEKETLKAVVTSSSPAPDEMVTMALTHPFAIIAIPKHEGPVDFISK